LFKHYRKKERCKTKGKGCDVEVRNDVGIYVKKRKSFQGRKGKECIKYVV